MDGVHIFALSLGVSIFLFGWALSSTNWFHLRRVTANPHRNAEEATLIQGRFSRRLHMSLVLAGLGAAVAFGSLLGRERATAFYWYGVVALAGWMCVLAILDGGATWSHVLKVRRRLVKKRQAILSEITSRRPTKNLHNEESE